MKDPAPPRGGLLTSLPRILYIMGTARSGSTLLDVLLGHAPGAFATGELSHWPRDAWDPERACSCGAAPAACPVWGEVQSRLRWDSADAARYAAIFRQVEWHQAVPARLLRHSSEAFTTWSRANAELLAAIRATTGADWVVDSSKYAGRALAVAQAFPDRVHVLTLTRSPAGLLHAFSKPRSGEQPSRSLPSSAAYYASVATSLRLATGRLGVPTLSLTFEDLLGDPDATLERIGTWSGLDLDRVREDVRSRHAFGIGHLITANRLRYEDEVIFQPSHAEARPDSRRARVVAGALGVLRRLLALLTAATVLLAPLSAEAGVPTEPGDLVSLRHCTPDPEATCWDDAPRLHRFGPGPGVPLSVVQADVRLAHHDGDLLVRIADLPEPLRVEVALARDEVGGIVQADVARGSGPTLVLTPEPALEMEQIRRLWLTLVDSTGPDRAVRQPVLAGPSHPSDGLRVFVGEVPPSPPDMESTDHGLVATAPRATLRVMELQPPERRGHPRERGPLWRDQAQDALAAPELPDSGWYALDTFQVDPRIAGSQHRFAWSRPVPDFVRAHGIHPAPRLLEERRGGPFRLRPEATVIAGAPAFEHAARLLADDLARYTGTEVTVRSGPPRKGDLWIGPPKSAPGRAQLVDLPADAPDGSFQLAIDRRFALVVASDPAGAAYGAVALADALGPDAQAPALAAADWPDLGVRYLFHRFDTGRAPVDVDTYVAFLRRVATRGRYNMLILMLRGAYSWQSHPELRRGNVAWSRDDLERVIQEARALGMIAVPGLSAPGHAEWILGHHRDLVEDNNGRLLCTRHPQTRPLLADLFDELIEVFDDPPYLHIGHDEVLWRTANRRADRCPRCSATPRWVLFGDHLDWTTGYLLDRGVTPIAWGDMLVEEWNGGREQVHLAPRVLSPAHRDGLVISTWADIGDAAGVLDGRGFEVWWGMTGVMAPRRRGLHDAREHVTGGGVALWDEAPWSAFSARTADSRVARYHASLVLMGGTTLWRTELSDVPDVALMRSLVDLPGLRFGHEALPAGEGHALEVKGDPVPTWAPQVHLDKPAVAATEDRVISIDTPPGTGALSLWLAAVPTRSAERHLQHEARRSPRADPVVARIILMSPDDPVETHELRYGIDLWRPDGDPRIVGLWGAAGARAASSVPDQPPVDRTLFRTDLLLPGARTVHVEATRPGWVVLVGAAEAVVP